MSLPYTDKTALQNYLKRTIAVGFDTQLTAYIEAMSRFADTYCSCILVDTLETTRKYDGTGDNVLYIDSCHDISAVTVDGTNVFADVYLYPANIDRKNTLEMAYNAFTRGRQNVEVTGVFAHFTELPEHLKFAVTVLVAGILNQVDKQTDGIKSEKVGEYQVTYKDDKERADYAQAMAILQSFRPIVF